MSAACPTCGRGGYIDDATVRTIREQYDAGVTQHELAERHNVSQSWVSNVVAGRRRPEAGGPIVARRAYNRRAVAT